MRRFLARLFGQSTEEVQPVAADAVEYKGYRIRAAPFRAEGQFQTAGTIEKDFPDGTKVHRFIRAERHGSEAEAAAFAESKGRQIIDQVGDAVFDG